MNRADTLYFAETDAQAAFDRAVTARSRVNADATLSLIERIQASGQAQIEVDAAYDALIAAQDAYRAVCVA